MTNGTKEKSVAEAFAPLIIELYNMKMDWYDFNKLYCMEDLSTIHRQIDTQLDNYTSAEIYTIMNKLDSEINKTTQHIEQILTQQEKNDLKLREKSSKDRKEFSVFTYLFLHGIWLADHISQLKPVLEYENETPKETSFTSQKSSDNKIPCDLTVEQLGFMIGLMIETNIIKGTNDRTRIMELVSEIYSTKKSENPSVAALVNNSYKPNSIKTLDYWMEKSMAMFKYTQKLKDDMLKGKK